MSARRAPGPASGRLWGRLRPFQADPLTYLGDAARVHGDIVRLRLGPFTVHLLNHPAHADHVLSRNARSYDKATRSAARIEATTGQSLLAGDSAIWERHRRLVQPAFQPRCFDGIAPVLDAMLGPMFARWAAAGEVDIVGEMMDLVIGAAIRILFSADIDPADINDPLEVLLADTWRRIEAPLDGAMLSVRFHRPAFKRARARIDAIVFDLIAARRQSSERPDDVLSRLLDAHEAEGDQALSDVELRDAAVTLLLAGHETTANAVAWAIIRGSEGHAGAEPQALFAEALRLYPSIWVIERRARAADEIGGYTIPKGGSVLISPYLMHRHPAFWKDPERFDRGRFAGARPRLSDGYLPFGHGPHRCVGLHLAQGMATHILARVFARFDVAVKPGQEMRLNAGITLRHGGPVRARVSLRT